MNSGRWWQHAQDLFKSKPDKILVLRRGRAQHSSPLIKTLLAIDTFGGVLFFPAECHWAYGPHSSTGPIFLNSYQLKGKWTPWKFVCELSFCLGIFVLLVFFSIVFLSLMFVFHLFVLTLGIILFLRESEDKKTWSWVDRDTGRSWSEVEEGKNKTKIYGPLRFTWKVYCYYSCSVHFKQLCW